MAKVLGRDFASDASLGANATGTTRTSIATVEDHEGLIKTCLAGETRFKGARRAEVVNKPWINTSNWTTVNATIAYENGKIKITATADGGYARLNYYTTRVNHANASDYVLTFRSSGPDTFRCFWSLGSTSTTLDVPAAEARYSKNMAHGGGGGAYEVHFGSALFLPLTSGEVIYAWDIQIEEVTGQTNQNPSEYVSVGVESSPYHGAGVDGVQYFPYENGNTVSSNVVTEAQGSDITGIGMLLEPAATNEATYSEDQSNAAWVASNVTKGSTSHATPAGAASTTIELTASAGNGTLLQSFTHASADWSYSVYLKRKTGTGNIDLTLDGGSTWTTKTITSSWARYDISQAAVTNPQFGIRIVTSADAIYAWGHFLGENSGAASSYVKNATTGATTRTTDTKIFYPLTTPQAAGMAVIEFAEAYPQESAAAQGIVTFDDVTTGGPLIRSAASNDIIADDDTTTATDTLTGDVTALAARWDDTGSGEMQVGFRTGVDTWAWGTASATYDGGFASDNNVYLLQSLADAANVANFDIYDTDEGTSWIESNYPATGADYTLTADAGSYTLTGADAGLTYTSAGYSITAEAGTYTFAGAAAGLTVSRGLSAEVGAYTLTGADAGLTYTPITGYSLAAEAGAYALIGADAGFTISRKLSAEVGAYSYSGANAGFVYGRYLTAEAGSYTFAGADISFGNSYALIAEAGAYTFTGGAASISYSEDDGWTMISPATTVWTEIP